jgi:hypothetical protein
MDDGQTGSVDAELHPAGLGGGERGFGPSGDLVPFVFGEGGQDVKHEAIGVRGINRDELSSSFHERADERDVARQAVEFGDHQDGPGLPAPREGFPEDRAVAELAALHFCVFV